MPFLYFAVISLLCYLGFGIFWYIFWYIAGKGPLKKKKKKKPTDERTESMILQQVGLETNLLQAY